MNAKDEPDSTPGLSVMQGGHHQLKGTCKMAESVRSKDWSQTPLGPIETWSDTLFGAVNTMLLSPSPAALYWGEELTLLFNDGYLAFLGERHPKPLGAPAPEVWREGWTLVGPAVLKAYKQGVPTAVSERFIPIVLMGREQDRWWSWGMYPIFENNFIVGVANGCEVAQSLHNSLLDNGSLREHSLESLYMEPLLQAKRRL